MTTFVYAGYLTSLMQPDHYLLLFIWNRPFCKQGKSLGVHNVVTASHCLLLIGAVVFVLVKQPCLEIRSRQPFEEV